MDLQTGHLEDRYHTRIILLLLFTMKFFCIFSESIFPKKCIFFAFWRKKIRRYLVNSLVSGVLQGLAKICKRYMEVNHFLLLICSFEKQHLVEWSLFIALVDNA